jgi:pimeloyl-ACP methyl ester carboxylesterase
MDAFTKKTVTTSRGMTYTYYVQPSVQQRPALLLQHGWPDDHELWNNTIPYLADLGYPIIAPDLLGYGGSSKPSDPRAYNSKDMSQDLIDILDNEGYRYAISVGHDWGSFIAARLTLWHPDRIVGLVLLNVAYRLPAQFDIEKVNQVLTQSTGLPRLAYQQFFTSPQGRDLIESRLESLFHAIHGNDEGTKNLMEDLLCHHGALENFLQNDKRQPLKDYAKDPAFKDEWIARMKRDGFEGPLNWYHASIGNHHWAVEKELPKERYRFNVPVLFIGCKMDAVCLTQAIYVPEQAGLLPDLKIEEIDSGHWQTFEAPDKSGPIINAWLKDREADFKPKL